MHFELNMYDEEMRCTIYRMISNKKTFYFSFVNRESRDRMFCWIKNLPMNVDSGMCHGSLITNADNIKRLSNRFQKARVDWSRIGRGHINPRDKD